LGVGTSALASISIVGASVAVTGDSRPSSIGLGVAVVPEKLVRMPGDPKKFIGSDLVLSK